MPKMIPLTVKFLVALTCFTAVYLTTEAVDTCPIIRATCLPGLPGRDGRDGQPGRDGSNGQPGRDGSNGQPGRDGATGPSGPPGPPITIDILDYIGAECRGRRSFHPATSCKEVQQCNSSAPSGYYWIRSGEGVVRVYCVMETNNCGNITGGWTRAAYIDMTNESNSCPQGLNYTVVSSTRMCTRSHTDGGCSSFTFPTFDVPYSKICGRARGYQYNSPDAFYKFTPFEGYPNVDGLIITHGSPRNHIWSFAAGPLKDFKYRNYAINCPCSSPYPGQPAPPAVGEDYFCESGNSGPFEEQWYLDDPLWDSQGCAANSTCCDRGGPWFTTTLSEEVRDDIEVSLCLDQGLSDEDVGVNQLEIYVY